MNKITIEKQVAVIINYKDASIRVISYTDEDIKEYDNDVEDWLRINKGYNWRTEKLLKTSSLNLTIE